MVTPRPGFLAGPIASRAGALLVVVACLLLSLASPPTADGPDEELPPGTITNLRAASNRP